MLIEKEIGNCKDTLLPSYNERYFLLPNDSLKFNIFYFTRLKEENMYYVYYRRCIDTYS